MSNNVKTLSVDFVVGVHIHLVRYFEKSADPISPPGLRSIALLESAVEKQNTGQRRADQGAGRSRAHPAAMAPRSARRADSKTGGPGPGSGEHETCPCYAALGAIPQLAAQPMDRAG